LFFIGIQIARANTLRRFGYDFATIMHDEFGIFGKSGFAGENKKRGKRRIRALERNGG
jgi:hypothetical protein